MQWWKKSRDGIMQFYWWGYERYESGGGALRGWEISKSRFELDYLAHFPNLNTKISPNS
jgi:hypothetical protein